MVEFDHFKNEMNDKQNENRLPRSSTETLIAALRAIANGGLHDEEGVVSAAIMEAADRLDEYNRESLIPSNSTGKQRNATT